LAGSWVENDRAPGKVPRVRQFSGHGLGDWRARNSPSRGVSQLVPKVGSVVSDSRASSRSCAFTKLARSAAKAAVASRAKGRDFAAAVPLPGAINTPADEFDASFLADSRTLVFARAPSMKDDRIDLFVATSCGGRYGAGMILPLAVNDRVKDGHGPMLDWSAPDRLTFSSQRGGAQSMELYRIAYRLVSGRVSGGQHGR
jgi:hypothetical protein